MKAKVRLTLLVIAVVFIGAAVWVSRLTRTEREQQIGGTQEALRKAAQLLQPDTTSDLRFGRKAPSTPAPQAPASPVP